MNGNRNINENSNADNSSNSMDSSNTKYALIDDGTGKKYDAGKSMVLESLGMDVIFLAGNSSAFRIGNRYF